MARHAISRAFLLACGLLLVLAGSARGDVVHLKDGRRIEGKVLVENARIVKVETRFGTLEFPRADVDRIEKGKTKEQEFREREARARSAEDFFALGRWAEEQRMRSKARKCMKRVLTHDPEHEGANLWLGNVRYGGEWMTPEERDKRQASDHEAEMRAKGLVRHGARWVTPEEKQKLEAGLVLFEGRWMTFAEAQRAEGLAEFEGAWIPIPEAVARRDVAAAAEALGAGGGFAYRVHTTAQAIVAGDLAAEELAVIGAGLDRARAVFDEHWGVEPGFPLFGDRLAEIYVVRERDDVYQGTCGHFAARTPTVPEGWAEAVARIHGFMWFDPYAVSSVRRWKRTDTDMMGHCYFNFGHLLVNRLGYEGTLLPPWYEEAVACCIEYAVHGVNTTFSRVREGTSSGTNAGKATFDVDPKALRAGDFEAIVIHALQAGRVPSFDNLARLEYHELEPLDTASGTMIVRWLWANGDIGRFHAALRADAPPLPQRTMKDGRKRHARYDAAFQAAVGMSSREADQAWRAWVLKQ